MSAHGFVPTTVHRFEEVIHRNRLYPLFVRDVENWIDDRGSVIAKRVCARPARHLVRVGAMTARNGHSSWEED